MVISCNKGLEYIHCALCYKIQKCEAYYTLRHCKKNAVVLLRHLSEGVLRARNMSLSFNYTEIWKLLWNKSYIIIWNWLERFLFRWYMNMLYN